jgi:sorbitol-specific phosphotransferase system component IIBC
MKTLSQAAQAAKLIRKELKESFPGTKFKVKSENYSGGNSIRVYWNLGPTTKEIEAIIDKYQYGHFNGMEDIYEYSNTNDEIPQVKFVFANRSMKSIEEENMEYDEFNKKWENEETVKHQMMKDLCKLHNIEYQGQYTKLYDNGRDTVDQAVNAIFSKSPLMNGYNEMKETGETAGLIEDLFIMA